MVDSCFINYPDLSESESLLTSIVPDTLTLRKPAGIYDAQKGRYDRHMVRGCQLMRLLGSTKEVQNLTLYLNLFKI